MHERPRYINYPHSLLPMVGFTMKIFGFTGTREGMNEDQAAYLTALVRGYHADGLGIGTVHHGDCIGADAYFHEVVRAVDPAIKIESHPCDLVKFRAYCAADVVHRPKRPLVRNLDIIKGVDYVIATPRELKPVFCSGTWYTIKRVRERGIRLFLILPDIGNWRPIIAAPKNATILRVRMWDGKEQFAHWAEDLSGSEQPAFSGWFANRGASGFYEIDEPKEWRSLTEEEQNHPDVKPSWVVVR